MLARTAEVRSLVVRAAGIFLPLAFLFSCSGLRYVRTVNLAGTQFVDRLILSGQSFRLVRSSEDGTVAYSGRFRIDGDMWTFEISSWSLESELPHRLDPPLLFVCKGRSFENGVAFFALSASHSPQQDAFLHLPTDFDLER